MTRQSLTLVFGCLAAMCFVYAITSFVGVGVGNDGSQVALLLASVVIQLVLLVSAYVLGRYTLDLGKYQRGRFNLVFSFVYFVYLLSSYTSLYFTANNTRESLKIALYVTSSLSLVCAAVPAFFAYWLSKRTVNLVQKVPLQDCLRKLADDADYFAVKDGDAVVAMVSANFPREKRIVPNNNSLGWILASAPPVRFNQAPNPPNQPTK